MNWKIEDALRTVLEYVEVYTRDYAMNKDLREAYEILQTYLNNFA